MMRVEKDHRNASRKWNRRSLAFGTAAAFLATFACNFIGALAAQHVTQSWSSAYLTEARSHLGATSLPNHGIAIFAGGNGTLLYKRLIMCVMRRGVSHFLRSKWRKFECCRYLQCDNKRLEHCGSQHPASNLARSHIAAATRSCSLRRWRR